MYICIYVYMYICKYVYIYISIYLNLYLYMYMHVHPWWIKHGNGRTTISSWFLSSYKPRLPCLITGEYIYIYIYQNPTRRVIHYDSLVCFYLLWGFYICNVQKINNIYIYIYIYVCMLYIYIIFYHIILYYIIYIMFILYYIIYYIIHYIILYYIILCYIYIYFIYISIYIHTKHVYPPRSIFTAEIPGRSSPVKVAPGYHGTSRFEKPWFSGIQ